MENDQIFFAQEDQEKADFLENLGEFKMNSEISLHENIWLFMKRGEKLWPFRNLTTFEYWIPIAKILLRALPQELQYVEPIILENINKGKIDLLDDVILEIEIAEERRVMMNMRRTAALSMYSNLRSAKHMGHCAREKGPWFGKVAATRVKKSEKLCIQCDRCFYKQHDRTKFKVPYFKNSY